VAKAMPARYGGISLERDMGHDKVELKLDRVFLLQWPSTKLDPSPGQLLKILGFSFFFFFRFLALL
jgi:hypothetical protein